MEDNIGNLCSRSKESAKKIKKDECERIEMASMDNGLSDM